MAGRAGRMSEPAEPEDGRGAARLGDKARWEVAARIRLEHPRWVVLWLARLGQYRAYPLFRAPRGTVVDAQDPDQLVTQMSQVEQEAPRRPAGTGR